MKSVTELNDFELEELRGQILAEQERRRNKKKVTLWENVKASICDYINEFGSISIQDYDSELVLSGREDFGDFGKIEILCR